MENFVTHRCKFEHVWIIFPSCIGIIMTTWWHGNVFCIHYCDVTMGAMASQITSLTIVYPTVHLGANQRKHQRSASLAFVWGIHRWPANSPHKWPVTRKCFHLMTSSRLAFHWWSMDSSHKRSVMQSFAVFVDVSFWITNRVNKLLRPL